MYARSFSKETRCEISIERKMYECGKALFYRMEDIPEDFYCFIMFL